MVLFLVDRVTDRCIEVKYGIYGEQIFKCDFSGLEDE